MSDPYSKKIASDLSISEPHVRAVIELLDSGSTLPFIARYRKEATGNLDELAIGKIRDHLSKYRQLDLKRSSIIRSLAKRDILTSAIEKKLLSATALAELEDIYLPFKPKRHSRAMVARERGLEPLARMIFAQDRAGFDPVSEASPFVDKGKGISSQEEALAGARDIMAEWMSEDFIARDKIRELYEAKGILRSRVLNGKEEEAGKFKDYFDWSVPISNANSHMLLAVFRGAKEGLLRLEVALPKDAPLAILHELFVRSDGPASQQVWLSLQDGYRRMLAPSMETEVLASARSRAEEMAIEVFAENLRQILLEPPLGQKCVLAIDPGFRTGCKLVVLDHLGRLLENTVIYPHDPRRSDQAERTLLEICKRFSVDAIAVGNGTAGRETEIFLRHLKLPRNIPVIMVNESGASVYSISDVAREEFPDHDATVRGAISIGRRLMDPLAELIKIEPMSLGVGQYQHDVDQARLRRALDDVVSACVNMVGVDVNAASKELLSYVSGLGPKLAQSIVNYRNEHGLFFSRHDLKKVPRLGPKSFEQAAGFLRINAGANPIDKTAVHPESYPIVERMAKDLGVSLHEMMQNSRLLKKIDLCNYLGDNVGLLTLMDIVDELSRPGRDPRREFESFSFAKGIEKIEDLKPGMKLPGIVTNVTTFGAFVDVGVHQDGLVHISQLCDGFVKNPSEVIKARQKVVVKVMDVDMVRKRISLSMKG